LPHSPPSELVRQPGCMSGANRYPPAHAAEKSHRRWFRVVGSPQGLLHWGSHRSGQAGFPHPALRVKLLRDGKRCERCAQEAEDDVARARRTAPKAAWRWSGGVATCARDVRPGAGSSQASVHCQSARNTHSDRAACCPVARAASGAVCGDIADTNRRLHTARDSTDPSQFYAVRPSCLSGNDPRRS